MLVDEVGQPVRMLLACRIVLFPALELAGWMVRAKSGPLTLVGCDDSCGALLLVG
jgi:hypothetical protein